ncbi:hypothetical protein V502_10101 [Pseudogymnoascus sp. VKM F-4520 (FW-2644)]|nr:hypothetical protein V502_10101 [Pseudogymnoascus sp. VKM F-4520 (FW-2644)]
MPHSRFYKSAVWRYDADELTKIAIRAAPTLIIPAICDTFAPISPYRTDVTHIIDRNFAIVDQRGYTDSDLEDALWTAFREAYNPLQDQILGITSLYSDDPTPRFKGIIRAHDISTPAFKSIISHYEMLAIVRHNADKYMEFMSRIVLGPITYKDLLRKIEIEASLDKLHFLDPEGCENLSRIFASRSARFDLATAYKNHLGLRYPDCKDVSVCFGCPDRARESDPQTAAEIEALGFRALMSPVEHHMFRRHLELVCESKLFDDHVLRMTTDMLATVSYHATYLGMAMFQCGLSEKEGKDAMRKCQELRDAIKGIVLGLPLAGRIVRHPDVIWSLGECLHDFDEYGTDSGGEGV